MFAYNDAGTKVVNIVQLHITERKKRIVAYVSTLSEADPNPVGTAFFVAVPHGQIYVTYAVTARHCVEEGVLKKETLFLEALDHEGKYKLLEVAPDEWIRSESTDLACHRLKNPKFSPTPLATDFSFREDGDALVCGLDTYSIGLLVFSPGNRETVAPIVRFGKLSLPEAKAGVYFDPRDEGDLTKLTMINARIIESHSFGGESGSPVFIYREHTRDPSSLPRVGASLAKRGGLPRPLSFDDDEIPTPLLGMVSSHWKSGVAVVVPSEEIRDFLMKDPKVKQDREGVSRVRYPTTPLSSNAKPEQLFTREDFESALKKVSKRLQPSQSDEGKSET